ncbi:MAG: FHA domain-containing protein [Proteobacteria bacterium]|nr:FHA domain-containing protein [Pseudomonadota bacterium]
MELGAAGLQEQPFPMHGKPVVFVPSASQQAACQFLSDTYTNNHGLGLFQGPPLSGKTAIIQHFTESLPEDAAVAVVDGTGLNTTTLLELVLSQFGYDLKLSSVGELVNMVKVFVVQQTASDHAPLLIIENTHALNPSALRVLCELAELKVKHKSALRLILASDRSISSIVEAPAMASIFKRLTGDFHLEPLTKDETTEYLHAKLRAGGCVDPQGVLPDDVCEALHSASGGWPGIVDSLVRLAMGKADIFPIRKDQIERLLTSNGKPSLVGEKDETSAVLAGPPKLYLTYNGRTLREIDVDRPRLLVGRSDHNDLCINSRYISRHHALFFKRGSATVLMDLNSTNGTYVNSRRVHNHLLNHDDVISIGNHGIKFHDPAARKHDSLDGTGFDETVVMKNLGDMRKLLARQNTQCLPTLSGKPSSAGDSKK